ncbi:MAG TPA: hypothetical protein VK997_00665 [Deferrisomatales bacterium]|nr:hypothetical protein [Deferrisomatales bacterium]
MNQVLRRATAVGFSVVFFGLALALGGLALEIIWTTITGAMALAEGLLKALNMAVISLATFELGLGVHKEYASHNDTDDVLVILRRTVARFVSIVCIALVLEGLLMVIKYSQLDLAGNLPYPVAIVASASLLLAALGAFLRLSREDSRGEVRKLPISGPWVLSPKPRHG